MSGNVVDPASHRPHMSGPARCICCGHEWVAVAPVGEPQLDCPICKTAKGVFVHPVSPRGETRWVCKCGSDLYYILPTGCQCYQCGTVQSFWPCEGNPVTTIAFDGKTMASDGRVTADDVIVRDDEAKVRRVGEKLIGFAGDTRFAALFVRWVEMGGGWPLPEGADYAGLVWDGHELLMYLSPQPDVAAVPWAIGSGRHAALAVMRAGGDAVKAVEVAKTMDMYSGGVVTAIQLTPQSCTEVSDMAC